MVPARHHKSLLQRGVCSKYTLILQLYHRIVSNFTGESPSLPRPTKTLSNICQLLMCLMFAGILTDKMQTTAAFGRAIPIFIVIRIMQVVFELLMDKQYRIDRKPIRNYIVSIVFIALIVVAHVVSIGQIETLGTLDKIEEWSQTFLIAILFEIGLWDFVLMPLIVLVSLKLCRPCFSRHLRYV